MKLLIILFFFIPTSSLFGWSKSCGALEKKLINEVKDSFITAHIKGAYTPCFNCPTILSTSYSLRKNSVFFDEYHGFVKVNGENVNCHLSELRKEILSKLEGQENEKQVKKVMRLLK